MVIQLCNEAQRPAFHVIIGSNRTPFTIAKHTFLYVISLQAYYKNEYNCLQLLISNEDIIEKAYKFSDTGG